MTNPPKSTPVLSLHILQFDIHFLWWTAPNWLLYCHYAFNTALFWVKLIYDEPPKIGSRTVITSFMTDSLKSTLVLSLRTASFRTFGVSFVMMNRLKSTPVLSLRVSWRIPWNQVQYCHYRLQNRFRSSLDVSWRTRLNPEPHCHYGFYDAPLEIKPCTVITLLYVLSPWKESCHDESFQIESPNIITCFMTYPLKPSAVLSLWPV